MLGKTRGIVLRHIKYSDTGIIAHIYTEQWGRQSYFIKRAHGKKSKIKANYFSPLFLLELEVSNKTKRELQVITEAKISDPLTAIPFNIVKSSLAIFISEVLYKSIKEVTPNPELFNFLYNYILLLDKEEKGLQNFHIIFLMQLTKYLGFFPNNNYSETNIFFDMADGRFTSLMPNHSYFLGRETSPYFSKLIDTAYKEAVNFKITKSLRNELLSKLILYYKVHLISLNEIKSYEILKEVFRR
ncbi:MAG: DNA repair protein RecO [Bacteroidia bacterium]|nr:DNA repair protein RecO [Bacteroidia bacterium]